jgi:cytochrome c oxidase subunit 3
MNGVVTDVALEKVKTGTGIGAPGSGNGEPPPGPRGGDDGEWPPGFTRDDSIEPDKYHIGMWTGMTAIVMLFGALTAAYILRQSRGLSLTHDWFPLRLPPVLWSTTGVLLLSSLTIEGARWALRRCQYIWFRTLIGLTTLLGFAFLAGQLRAWLELVDQGVFIYSHPHSSFFYVFTAVHAIHLMGGLLGLVIVTIAAMRLRITAGKRNAVNSMALYWHLMDGLWVYLFALLFFFRQ